MQSLVYRVQPASSAHRFHLQLQAQVEAGVLELWLPIWIPGSYCRRDFSKYISHLEIKNAAGEALPWQQIAPSRWRLTVAEAGNIDIHYRVYAHDVSVRGCYLDHERAVFNPCAACIMIAGQEQRPIELRFDLQGKHHNWNITGAEALQGVYHFENHADLVDTPFMLAAQMKRFHFEVGGVPHEFAITGREDYDLARLQALTQRGCEAAYQMFGAFPEALQGKKYIFMLHSTGGVRGGLEHRRSTLLMHRRDAMRQRAMEIDLLGLIVHEYFHTWNVKDLLPATYQPYDLRQEQPDDMLWLFEGYTAYFDNLLLKNSGLISEDEYWNLIENDINSDAQRGGWKRQSLAQASIEAWTKFYNGGEDAANISVHYYVRGSLAALCLDAWLQQHADINLAQLLRQLWLNFCQTRQGLTEALYREQVEALLPESCRAAFQTLLTRFIHGTEALPLKESLAFFQRNLITQALEPSTVGAKWNQQACIVQLDDEGEAAQAGLAMGDVILSIDEEAANEALLKAMLLQSAAGTTRRVRVLRDGLHYDFELTLAPNPQQAYRIQALSA